MVHLSRHDLADRLAELSRRLRASGAAIDLTFDLAFRELSDECATVCVDAGAPLGLRNRNAQIYSDLAWGIVQVVTIRIGGVGTNRALGQQTWLSATPICQGERGISEPWRIRHVTTKQSEIPTR